MCYDEAAFDKRIRKPPEAAGLLRKFRERLATAEPFDAPTLERLVQDFVQAEGIELDQIIHALRVAVTGKAVGFGLYESLAILGERVVWRGSNGRWSGVYESDRNLTRFAASETQSSGLPQVWYSPRSALRLRRSRRSRPVERPRCARGLRARSQPAGPSGLRAGFERHCSAAGWKWSQKEASARTWRNAFWTRRSPL